ncbi:MAG TPA: hypothetical protein VMU02_09860 [bacterium]|nr:hypothetical protein [bacterium]
MAETQKAKAGKKPAAQEEQQPRRGTLVLRKPNVLLMVAGIVVILIGYLLLGKGSVSAAPILLVLGYCVIIPLAIVLWTRKPDDKPQSGTGE